MDFWCVLMQSKNKEYHIRLETEASAVNVLAEKTGLSKQKIKSAMQKGALWHGSGGDVRRVRRASKLLAAGDELHFYYDESILSQTIPEPELIAQESGYSLWYKPGGVRSQGSKWGDHCTIHRYVEQHSLPQRPVFIVHRLDRAASGLMLLAHSKKLAKVFSQMFAKREIEKWYQVMVRGRFPKDLVVLDQPIEQKESISHVQVLNYDEQKDLSLLNVQIVTGRKHQIRKHLSTAGFPVLNDRLYGSEPFEGDLCLVSYRLRFMCPESAQEKDFCLEKSKCLG